MKPRFILSLLVMSTTFCEAVSTISLDRDRTFENALRWEASADKTITPQKVIRHLFADKNSQSKPPATEFQPIVHVKNDRVRIIAAIAYKF